MKRIQKRLKQNVNLLEASKEEKAIINLLDATTTEVKLNKLTKKYIFSCKLKGKPVEFDSSVLYHKGILKLLSLTGVWEKDPIFTSILTSTYAFTILYPIRLIEVDGHATFLGPGDHWSVCL